MTGEAISSAQRGTNTGSGMQGSGGDPPRKSSTTSTNTGRRKCPNQDCDGWEHPGECRPRCETCNKQHRPDVECWARSSEGKATRPIPSLMTEDAGPRINRSGNHDARLYGARQQGYREAFADFQQQQQQQQHQQYGPYSQMGMGTAGYFAGGFAPAPAYGSFLPAPAMLPPIYGGYGAPMGGINIGTVNIQAGGSLFSGGGGRNFSKSGPRQITSVGRTKGSQKAQAGKQPKAKSDGRAPGASRDGAVSKSKNQRRKEKDRARKERKAAAGEELLAGMSEPRPVDSDQMDMDEKASPADGEREKAKMEEATGTLQQVSLTDPTTGPLGFQVSPPTLLEEAEGWQETDARQLQFPRDAAVAADMAWALFTFGSGELCDELIQEAANETSLLCVAIQKGLFSKEISERTQRTATGNISGL